MSATKLISPATQHTANAEYMTYRGALVSVATKTKIPIAIAGRTTLNSVRVSNVSLSFLFPDFVIMARVEIVSRRLKT